MGKYTLILVCGLSVKAAHNTFYAHLKKNQFKFEKAIFLVSKSSYVTFFQDLEKLIHKSARKYTIQVPELDKKEIPSSDLSEIQDSISKLLPCNYFILDVTGGRKIMAVGASRAYQESNAKKKKMSYYLLKTSFNNVYKDMLIFNLFEDEWGIYYYD